MSNGYSIALACGPLRRQRYINSKIELELRDFKKEIEEKFGKSKLATFQMPRLKPLLEPTPRDSYDHSDLSTKYQVQSLTSQGSTNTRHNPSQRNIIHQSADQSTIHSYLHQVQSVQAAERLRQT